MNRTKEDQLKISHALLIIVTILTCTAVTVVYFGSRSHAQLDREPMQNGFDAEIAANGQQMLQRGRDIFRFDTFGDEAYWSDKLKLHQAIEGSKFGGVGAGVSPKTALAVGL